MPIGEGDPVAPSRRVAAVLLVAQRLLELDPETDRRSPEQVGADLVHLRHGIDLLEIGFSGDAARFAATSEYDTQGSVTAIDWIRHSCRMSGHAAAERVCLGEQLESLPQSLAAATEGALGYAHLALMARTASWLGGARAGLCRRPAAGAGAREQRQPLPPPGPPRAPRGRSRGVRRRAGAGHRGSMPLPHSLRGRRLPRRRQARRRRWGNTPYRPRTTGPATRPGRRPLQGAPARRCAGRAGAARARQRPGPQHGEPACPPPDHGVIRHAARAPRRSRGGDGVLAPHLRQDGRAHRVRLQLHPGAARLRLSRHRRRPVQAGGAGRDPAGAQRPRPTLRLARLRPPGQLDCRPSPEALDTRRTDRFIESGVALSPPPLDGPRGRLAAGQRRRRSPPDNPAAHPPEPLVSRADQRRGGLAHGLSGRKVNPPRRLQSTLRLWLTGAHG